MIILLEAFQILNLKYQICLIFTFLDPGDSAGIPATAIESEQPGTRYIPDVSVKSHVCVIPTVKSLLETAGVVQLSRSGQII